MRILIFGGGGMLGHQLLVHLSINHDVKITLHSELERYQAFNLFTEENSYTNIDVSSSKLMRDVINDFKPEVVINAVGIIKQREDANAYIPNLEINALMPHKLSKLCENAGARLIHLSTDCVFSGNKGNYVEDDFPDVVDLYGRCKYLGEVKSKHCVTFRTSIIGMELLYKKSLIEWFLSQKGNMRGFSKAIYTGVTTMEMARVIENVLVNHTDLSGVYHLASEPISKYVLLRKLAKQLNLTSITIEPDDTLVCDRSLCGEKFKRETGYEVPSWDDMIYELANIIKLREKGISI